MLFNENHDEDDDTCGTVMLMLMMMMMMVVKRVVVVLCFCCCCFFVCLFCCSFLSASVEVYPDPLCYSVEINERRLFLEHIETKHTALVHSSVHTGHGSVPFMMTAMNTYI